MSRGKHLNPAKVAKPEDKTDLQAAVRAAFHRHCESEMASGQEFLARIQAESDLPRTKSERHRAECAILDAAAACVKTGMACLQARREGKPSAYQQKKAKIFHEYVEAFNFTRQELTKQGLLKGKKAAEEGLKFSETDNLAMQVGSFNKYLLPEALYVLVGDDYVSVPVDYSSPLSQETRTVPDLKSRTEADPAGSAANRGKPGSTGLFAPSTRSQTEYAKQKQLRPSPLESKKQAPEHTVAGKAPTVPMTRERSKELTDDIKEAQMLIEQIMLEQIEVKKKCDKNPKNRVEAVKYDILQAAFDCIQSGKQLMECELKGQQAYELQFKTAYTNAEQKFRRLIGDNEILYKKTEKPGFNATHLLVRQVKNFNRAHGEYRNNTGTESKTEQFLLPSSTNSVAETMKKLGETGFFARSESMSATALQKDMKLTKFLTKLQKIADEINTKHPEPYPAVAPSSEVYTGQERAKLKLVEAINELVYIGCNSRKTKTLEAALARLKNLQEQYHDAYTFYGFNVLDSLVKDIIMLAAEKLPEEQRATWQR